jgi:chorismate dehydratase
MTEKIKVTAVSYLNTIPFVYGLQHTSIQNEIILSLDYPAECSRKMISGECDFGLVPVAAIPTIPLYNIVSDFCIGAQGPVRTVVLLSNSPIETLERVYLDYQSRTSVVLVKVLSHNLWNINPEWTPYTPEHSLKDVDPYEGLVVIGDKVFELESHFKYKYDLAEEWIRLTGLPFVFAAWTANKKIEDSFISTFNSSLRKGVHCIKESIDLYPPSKLTKLEAEFYLRNNISFDFNKEKHEALKLFWSLAGLV